MYTFFPFPLNSLWWVMGTGRRCGFNFTPFICVQKCLVEHTYFNIPNSKGPNWAIYLIQVFLHSRVIQVENHDILCADAHQLVHHVRHLGPLHHRADRSPLGVLEGRNRRRTTPGRDRGRGGERLATDVVLTYHVLTRRDHTRDARRNLVDQWRQVGMFRHRGTDQNRFGTEKRRDRSETCSSHRLTRFCVVYVE
jgi:hypothetical protein